MSALPAFKLPERPLKMDARAKEIRTNIINVSASSGHGHIPTSFSIVDALCAVYNTMSHDPKQPKKADRDIFILSKGHAALGFYCTLATYGYFPIEEVYGFGKFDQKFGCHPDRTKVPGAEASTGSLGHGISLAAGMALGMKIKGENKRRAYTLIGDGESNEGTVWETIMVSVHRKLDNLTIIFDANNSQIRCMPVDNAAARFAAFGCDVHEVDGHDIAAMEKALKAPAKSVKVLVAHTVKGYGCRSLHEGTGMFEWHRRSPKPEEREMLLGELDAYSV